MFAALLCGRWRGSLTSFPKERGIIACRPTSGSSEMCVASASYSVCVGWVPLSWNGSPKWLLGNLPSLFPLACFRLQYKGKLALAPWHRNTRQLNKYLKSPGKLQRGIWRHLRCMFSVTEKLKVKLEKQNTDVTVSGMRPSRLWRDGWLCVLNRGL